MDLPLSFVRFADRRRVPMLVLSLLAASAGAAGTVKLYGDLRTDVRELLPETTRSARDLEAVTRRVGGFSEETVVLYGADKMSLEVFADDLADELSKAPKDLIRSIEYRSDELKEFFRPRLLFFLERGELERLRDAMKESVRWDEGRRAGGEGRATPPDVLGLLKRKMTSSRRDLLGRFADGYYAGEVLGRTPGERTEILVMIVRMEGTPDSYRKLRRLDRTVKDAVARLEPHKYYPGLKVAYAGHVTSSIMEHDALAEDLVWATLLVVFAVALAVAIYNRTWKAVLAVGFPLLVGTLATFGLAELFIGHLNSNTAFLGSIVVGNGINVGLIFFARYLEERRRGSGPIVAMEVAVRETWLGTLTAAFAAGAAYASLMSTDFRGFNQFGLIGGIGMALCWITSYVVTPPLVLAWERIAPIPRPGQRPARPVFTRAVSAAVERAPRLATALAAGMTLFAIYFAGRLAADPIEHDFSKLRDESALREGGPAWWDERVDSLFGRHLTPTVILAHDEKEARSIAHAVEDHRLARPDGLIGPVLSIGTVVPEGQDEKLPIIREIRALASPEHLGFLPPDERAAIAKAIPPADLGPFGSADLPEGLRRQLTETSGLTGTPVLVYPSERMNMWNGRDMLRFAEELRSIPLPPGVPSASWILLMADMLRLIAEDGPRATLLSLAGVAAIVLVAFGLGKRSARSFTDAAWVLASLLAGVVWFLGLAGALGMRLNVLNFIALPITFGIGVDYATNIFQRRRLDQARSIAEVLRTTGGAVALCSLTTIIGYSSLLVARNQALFSFGVLADLGEAACLAAALLALPSLLRLRELWRERKSEALEMEPQA